ncbi:hypothetical protein CRYUN_Cryun08bG0042200 [Craigia yunnanensis]
MNNLLTESFEIPRDQGSRGGDIELGAQMNSGELGLQSFFKKVQEIDKQYEKLDKLLKKLQDAHEETKAVTKAPSMKSIKQRMEKDVDEVGKISRFIKGKIEELDRENLANRQKPGCGKGTGVDRSRTATTLAVKKKLKDKMAEFQTLRETIHQEYREVVERRVFTVTGARPDEETIENLIDTGDSEQIFQKAIQEQGRGRVCLKLPYFFPNTNSSIFLLLQQFQEVPFSCFFSNFRKLIFFVSSLKPSLLCRVYWKDLI